MPRYANFADAMAAMRSFDADATWTVRRWMQIVETSSIQDLRADEPRDMVSVYLLATGLLADTPSTCSRCGLHFVVKPANDEDYPLGVAFHCGCPRRRPVNILHNTFWQGRTIEKQVPFYFLYAAGYSASMLAREFQITLPTAQRWRHDLQLLLAQDVIAHGCAASVRVGSPGQRVFVDETLLNKRKPAAAPYARVSAPHLDKQIWLWGAVAEHGFGEGQVMYLLLTDLNNPRSAPSLERALLACVQPGSRIVHDDWGAYRALPWNTLPFHHDERSIVNHKKEIVNTFGEHTNAIESVWGVLKRWLRSRNNGRIPKPPTLEGELWEFLWRRRVPEGTCVTSLHQLLQEMHP